MKKILTFMLCAAMAISLVACSSAQEEESSAAESQTSESSQPESESEEPQSEGEDDSATDDITVDQTLTTIHTELKTLYGEAYIPSMPIDATMLGEVYGIDMANVDSFIAEAPMISTHVDTFIAIKATEGMGQTVTDQLNAYRDKLVSDTMQYPSNLDKIQASQVVTVGDYAFFVMLGAPGDNLAEDEWAAHAQSEIQKGVDKINEILSA